MPRSGRSDGSSLVNTETNWLFSIFALVLGFICEIPLCFRGAIPEDSHFLLFYK